ncbi:MAG: phosphohistidine phosphatase [Verrucomicrobia bacterium CG_4_10_14_3_um_filter_43_23]|nr:MAG: hypothetical protein AUJ82_08615 [Verrucomicrobia bacterium CG1_02_43_26]PIP58543.1 MAG: phosphohistidine phosphatase [Verrucomicrobia bacterium CG22_combo_CG10-13_8_21_14_all_43_17]PIX58341.1 MAG: phosphohistidine phosphatase [Verrucomicrobia bacterium CG_4_10_14_3_um_filter_43_23]PIY60868.1 MAG: phosphohistidine phosphatase [Verrucomicrobia bacterium CG_4_10_14_0_8_um_filter_43_34]PJA44358.1 MAG: phosphohistidine phosphatase [Verrucomicrobia bacterium CG_4_9_14_3_um_filter_43_20]
MKTLTLFRHAKSDWGNNDIKDFDRPLNERGQKEAPIMGKVLHNKEHSPDLIISSSALRAFTTAQLVAKELDYPETNIQVINELYNAPAGMMLRIIQRTDDSVNHLFVFGHNPGISDLACQYIGERSVGLRTSEAVTITFNVDSWKSCQIRTGKLLHYFANPSNADYKI